MYVEAKNKKTTLENEVKKRDKESKEKKKGCCWTCFICHTYIYLNAFELKMRFVHWCMLYAWVSFYKKKMKHFTSFLAKQSNHSQKSHKLLSIIFTSTLPSYLWYTLASYLWYHMMVNHSKLWFSSTCSQISALILLNSFWKAATFLMVSKYNLTLSFRKRSISKCPISRTKSCVKKV